MTMFAILITKLAGAMLQLIHRGGSLPGQIGLKLCPDILKKLRIDCPLILVTGTNGKTSTSNMIAAMLEQEGRIVVNNRKGDNLKEGINDGFTDAHNAKKTGTGECYCFGSG